MRQRWRLAAVLQITAAIAGCADGPPALVHDLVVFWNEVCDNMLKATDEESAKKLLEVQFKLLDAKFESLKARTEKLFINGYDKQEALALEDSLMDYRRECEAVAIRLDKSKERVEKIM